MGVCVCVSQPQGEQQWVHRFYPQKHVYTVNASKFGHNWSLEVGDPASVGKERQGNTTLRWKTMRRQDKKEEESCGWGFKDWTAESCKPEPITGTHNWNRADKVRQLGTLIVTNPFQFLQVCVSDAHCGAAISQRVNYLSAALKFVGMAIQSLHTCGSHPFVSVCWGDSYGGGCRISVDWWGELCLRGLVRGVFHVEAPHVQNTCIWGI